MQELVTFWRDCGLITGQRTPSSSEWPDPKAKDRGLKMLAYLKDRLDVIETEFGRFTDKGNKLRLVEISQWKDAILNCETEPTGSDIRQQNVRGRSEKNYPEERVVCPRRNLRWRRIRQSGRIGFNLGQILRWQKARRSGRVGCDPDVVSLMVLAGR